VVAVVQRPGRQVGTTAAVSAGSTAAAELAAAEPGTAGPAPRPRRFTALVVLAHPVARAALARRLFALGARDVAEAATMADARLVARRSGPRPLVVVETWLPDGSGLALLNELRAAGWAHGLVIAGSDDPSSVRAALSCGVRGLLVTRPAPAAPAPVIGLRSRTAVGVAALSAREIEVLRLVADGRSNREAGEVLGLSALTVKSHLARIARKLGTGDRAEMVVLAMRGGLFR
jgi:DNA-binding NarL/FixJ family response regulator